MGPDHILRDDIVCPAGTEWLLHERSAPLPFLIQPSLTLSSFLLDVVERPHHRHTHFTFPEPQAQSRGLLESHISPCLLCCARCPLTLSSASGGAQKGPEPSPGVALPRERPSDSALPARPLAALLFSLLPGWPRKVSVAVLVSVFSCLVNMPLRRRCKPEP